ncbi:G-protein coupled receptor [Paragonimus heterotremus]|uniref:G-protein coupled receptor n=1 Tax=Paragonimus heterotremus TaxID=100268 RepID=A0A8J4SVC2_9TREM|nr:G-protein coupled receptor [Paragonimus heterotremus]
MDYIILFIAPVILLVGTVGNFLSFILLCRRSKFNPATYFYLAVLALVDQGVLFIGLLRKWTDTLSGSRLEDRHWLLCKSLNFTGITTSYLSVWIIVVVTVERAMVIILPFQVSHSQRTRRARIVLSSMIVLFSLISSHFFFTLDVVSESIQPAVNISDVLVVTEKINNNQTTFSNVSIPLETMPTCDFERQFIDNHFKKVWMWIDAALYSYIPFLLITIFNLIILISLRGASKKRASLLGSWNFYGIHNSRPNTNSTFKLSNRKWRSPTKFWSQRARDRPAQKVCSFCAQSFPIDQFHSKPEESNPRPGSSGSSHTHDQQQQPQQQQHQTQNSPRVNILQSIGQLRPSNTPVNIRFQSYRLNGIEVNTMNVVQEYRQCVTSEMRQLTILLLLISGTFLITTAPVVVVKMLITWTEFTEATVSVVLDSIAEMLMYTNHAANFYLYIAVGTRFRGDLRKMFCCTEESKNRRIRRQI